MAIDNVPGNGTWSSTIFIDSAQSDEHILLFDGGEGLQIVGADELKLDKDKVAEIRKALQRYERWCS